MKDLKKRTITAIILVTCLIPIVYFGGLFIDIACGLLCLGAAWELEHMYKGEGKWTILSYLHITLSVLSYVSFIFIGLYRSYVYLAILLFFVFLIEGFFMIFTKESDINTLGRGLITIFYPSIGFASLVTLRNMPVALTQSKFGGLFLLIYVVLVCFMTDNFAYVFGSKYGKHQLAPIISPHKTWEGSIAGTVFAAVFPPVFTYFASLNTLLFPLLSSGWAIVASIFLSIALSVVDEIGDLFASKLKRHYGLKDYSQIFPGHGGILDRFDSYVFVGVATLLWLILVRL